VLLCAACALLNPAVGSVVTNWSSLRWQNAGSA